MHPIRNLSDIGTSVSQHLRSIPVSHRSPYLECHILAKQKELLEKQIVLHERRRQQCRQRVAEIEARLEGERRAGADLPPLAPTECSERGQERFRRMTLDY